MKKLAVILLISALVMTCAACTNSKNGAESTVKESSTATTVAETQKSEAPKEKVKLMLGLPQAYDVTPKEVVDNFVAAHPEIEVTRDETPWGDFKTKLVTQIAAGNPPDVFMQEAGVIAGYGAKGACVDLTEYINRDLKADEYTTLLFAGKTPDGKIWGIPHGVNPIALAYNKKIFTDANVPFPTNDWTYQDMFDAAKKLTKDTNGDGKTDIYGFLTWMNITQGWFPFIHSTGGHVLDSTLTKAMFNDPKSIEGLKKFHSLANVLKISPTKAEMDAVGANWDFFASGKAAIYFIQAAIPKRMAEKYPDCDYDTVMMPKGWDGSRVVPTVVNNWAMFSKSDKKVQDAAWEFLKYYLSDEGQKIVGQKALAGFPVKLSGLTEVGKDSNKPGIWKAFTDGIAQGGQTLDDNPTWSEWVAVTQKIMFDLYDGKISPEEAAKKATEEVQKILDSE